MYVLGFRIRVSPLGLGLGVKISLKGLGKGMYLV